MLMFLLIAPIALASGVIVSLANGKRWLPSIISTLALCLGGISFAHQSAYVALAALLILAAVIWSANRLDLSNAENNLLGQAVCCGLSGFIVLGWCLAFWLWTKPKGPTPDDPWNLAELFRTIYYAHLPLLSVALLLLALRFWKRLRRLKRKQSVYGQSAA